MKGILFIFFLIFRCNVFAVNEVSSFAINKPGADTTVIPNILALRLSYYIGKPADSLLLVLPAGYTDRGFMPIGAGYAKGLYQTYAESWENNCAVEIYVDTFQYLPIPNRTPTVTWNMNLAKQEKISFIKVYKNNNTCLYGCNDPRYYNR
jgi:hypothetical protein